MIFLINVLVGVQNRPFLCEITKNSKNSSSSVYNSTTWKPLFNAHKRQVRRSCLLWALIPKKTPFLTPFFCLSKCLNSSLNRPGCLKRLVTLHTAWLWPVHVKQRNNFCQSSFLWLRGTVFVGSSYIACSRRWFIAAGAAVLMRQKPVQMT